MLTKIELRLKRETIRIIYEALTLSNQGLEEIPGFSKKSVYETNRIFDQIHNMLPTKIGLISITEVSLSLNIENIKIISNSLEFSSDFLINDLEINKRLVERTCDFFASLTSLILLTLSPYIF